jgi:Ca2+ transporting ATPase
MVFKTVTHCVGADGSRQEIDSDAGNGKTYKQNLDDTVKKFADNAYRTILTSFRTLTIDEFEALKEENGGFLEDSQKDVLEEGLCALCIFGIQDPLRVGIVESITKCKTAGITVIMCTGDNIDTATAISRNAGIITQEQIDASEYSCMIGEKFRDVVGGMKEVEENRKGKMVKVEKVGNQHKFDEVKKHLRVLGRCSPLDKKILVTGMQDSGQVVAVTGDGTNDAPALTKADVGFAMGIAGTDVAKNACDIVLLDDNFSSIIVALKYGRNVYDNVRKFLQFQLSVNVVAMFIVFFGSVILKDSPLTAVQMLWVNLIMDTLGALALATEPPTDDILLRQPYKKDNLIITPVMWRNVFGHGVYQIIVLMIVMFYFPGKMCEVYWTACNEYKTPLDTKSGCSKYNAFYANELYETEVSLKFWTKTGEDPKNYDTDTLQKFSCW